MPSCPASCPIFAPCEADLDGGRCVPVTVSFVAPPDLSIWDAGASVSVQVDARLRDGGLHAIMVPLSSSFGTAATRSSGVSAPLALPSTGGVHRLFAGWDGGPGASVQVSTLSCVASCQPWQQCRPTVDGGACDSLNLSLAWNSPDAGLAFNTATVPARLTVTRSGGPIPASLTSVPVFGQGGPSQAGSSPLSPLTGSAGAYTGALPLYAPDSVSKTFVAGWPDGGPTATLVIERDTTPPMVTVVPITRPTTLPDPDPFNPAAWKRHETALVRVDVTGGRPAVATDLAVFDAGVAFSISGRDCGCAGASTCRCFDFPLARTPLTEVSPGRVQAEFVVRPFSDAVGNASLLQQRGLDVSRVLWDRLQSIFSPDWLAVTSQGVILFEDRIGSSSTLKALEPDGGLLWSYAPVNTSFTAPATIGATEAYLPTSNASGSRIVRIDLATGNETGQLCETAGVGPFGPVTLAQGIVGAEIPFAVREDSIVAAVGSCPDIKVQFVHTDVVARSGSGGLIEVFATTSDSVTKSTFDGFSFADAGTLATLPTPDSLFLAGTQVGWTTTGSGSSVVAAPTATPFQGPLTLPVVAYGSRPLAANGAIVGSAFGQIVACQFSASSGFFGTCAGNPGTGLPLVGSGGRLLEVTSGDVRERSATTALISTYSTQGFRSPRALLVPMRNPDGTKRCNVGVGVLIQAASGVRATIVDLEGLDGAAPWPVFRHDPANSGYLNRSLAPWSCP
jgi:hypothetical protein